MRKSAPLLFFALLLVLPFSIFYSSDKLKPPDQDSGAADSGFLVNLVVDEMSEQAEDSGGVIRVNANFDEQNKNADGNPLADYQPDYMQGHRIVAKDPNLNHGSLSIDGPGKGRWRLIFPENIKVWKEGQ
ncbi:MAG: hypothetical protein GTO24_03315, partial [candidate division Zixibacteria bacterium]|nr:hypothetical protein [candidate division Zixibacteria bacterium]